MTLCTYFVTCGLFSLALFNVWIYTALENGTVLNVQLERMWKEVVVAWFDMLSHIAWRDLQIPRRTLLGIKRSVVLLLGTALSVTAPSSRETGKKDLKRLVPLYQTTRGHIPQYDVLCCEQDRNCIWNYGWKPAEKSAPCSCFREYFVLYMRNQKMHV